MPESSNNIVSAHTHNRVGVVGGQKGILSTTGRLIGTTLGFVQDIPLGTFGPSDLDTDGGKVQSSTYYVLFQRRQTAFGGNGPWVARSF